MAVERRASDRKRTEEFADLYYQDQFIKSCRVSCISPQGLFVDDELPLHLTRGVRVELYFPIDPVTMPGSKLLCLKGVVARRVSNGAGIRIYAKRLPLVPPG